MYNFLIAVWFCGSWRCLKGHDETLTDAKAHYIYKTAADLEVPINRMFTTVPDARLSLA